MSIVGIIGEVSLFAAFTACVIALLTFFRASRDDPAAGQWKAIARVAWGVMTISVLLAAGMLLYFILTHQFQFKYVYSYTSRDLPLAYLISSFWAGQEGSFLVWIIFNALVGAVLIRWARSYEALVMTAVALSQVFLLLMILGAQVGPLSVGSSPFTTLAEYYPDNPNLRTGFIPADGSGLKDMLQNPWMVVHGPLVFLGYALLAVPYGYALAGLWSKRYTQWVRPALPWALAGNLVLLIGIVAGGYWAYITLSFGGYWAWDPVENSSLVPWLLGAGALHVMVSQKKGRANQKAALLLSIGAYLLAIYATFLTRSGLLGEISVHSFTDLGLYGQLLVWLGVMSILGFGSFIYRYRDLPALGRHSHLLSREFFIFCGAMILTVIAAVIIIGTSAPIIGHLFREAPSAVPVSFYNNWTLPLWAGMALLAGLGQLLWWRRMKVTSLNRQLLPPLVLALLSTAAVSALTPFARQTVDAAAVETAGNTVSAGLASSFSLYWQAYGVSLMLLVLVFSAFVAFYGNGLVLWRIGRGNPKLVGGALTHIGVAMVVIGVIASSAFNDPISPQAQTLDGSKRENFVITQGDTMRVDNYRVAYHGATRREPGRTRYRLTFTGSTGRTFSVRPVVYHESRQDHWMRYPDVIHFADKDVYVAVAPPPMFENPPDSGKKAQEVVLEKGETVSLGHDEYALTFQAFNVNASTESIPDSAVIAVAAKLQLRNQETGQTRSLSPLYMVMEDRSQQYVQNKVSDWNISVTFAGMEVDSGSARLVIQGAQVDPEKWLLVQAYEKPFINLLWLGVIVMAVGYGFSIYRRADHLRDALRRGVL